MTSLCECFMYVQVCIYIYSIYILVVCSAVTLLRIQCTGRTFLQCARKGPVLGLLHFSLLHTNSIFYRYYCVFLQVRFLASIQHRGTVQVPGKCSQRPPSFAVGSTKAFMDFLRMFLDCSDAEAF